MPDLPPRPEKHPPLLALDEQVLLRAWIRGVPLAALSLPEGQRTFVLLKGLRTRLYLKALRLNQALPKRWLKRRSHADWERAALDSLDDLLQHADIAPGRQQPLSYWLAPAAVDALTAAGLYCVDDLLICYQRLGKAWWQAITGLGRSGAKQVESTLEELLPGLLCHQPPALPMAYAADIVPLERFLLPEPLDGTQGSNRAEQQPFIPMPHDLAAIQAWLSLLAPGSHTLRSYRREAERLLLWAILVQQKALSSLDATDLAAYRRFLQDPQPAETWIGPPQSKIHPQWRPFTGPLSKRSAQHAETLLNGLFTFLVTQRYLQHNPYSVLPKLRVVEGQTLMGIHRAFSPAQWQFIVDRASQAVQQSAGQAKRKAIRTEMVLHLTYATGLRLHELTQVTTGDLFVLNRQGQEQHWLSVVGKGQKLRQVPLPPTVILALGDAYLKLTGKILLKQSAENPLIPDLHDTSKALKPLAVYKALKGFFKTAAAAIEETDPASATHLLKASTHWLRHTHGSVAAAQQIPLAMIRDNLGHASITTTSLYLHAEEDARYEAFKVLAPTPTTENPG